MTFKEMIFNGLCDGTVKIITNPNDGYPACQIGEDWFYFIEDEYGESSPAELLTPDEIYKSYTKEELAEMIYFALQCKEKQAREEDIPELSDEVAYYKAFLEERYTDKEQKSKTHMAEWHYMAKEPPKKTGYYQVAVDPGVILTDRFASKDGKEHLRKRGNSYPAVCFWDGKAWDNKLSLEIDDAGGAIWENETIYAWTDVFSSDVPNAEYPDKSVTINLSDYHLTEAQLKAFLNDYKENYEYESKMREVEA